MEAAFLEGPLRWTPQAEAGLCRSLGNQTFDWVRTKIESGAFELWRVNRVTYCVTEKLQDVLWIWMLEGREALRVFRMWAQIAQANKLQQLGLFTYHRAFLRALAPYAPKVETTDFPGEYRLTMDIQRVLA